MANPHIKIDFTEFNQRMSEVRAIIDAAAELLKCFDIDAGITRDEIQRAMDTLLQAREEQEYRDAAWDAELHELIKEVERG